MHALGGQVLKIGNRLKGDKYIELGSESDTLEWFPSITVSTDRLHITDASMYLRHIRMNATCLCLTSSLSSVFDAH